MTAELPKGRGISDARGTPACVIQRRHPLALCALLVRNLVLVVQAQCCDAEPPAAAATPTLPHPRPAAALPPPRPPPCPQLYEVHADSLAARGLMEYLHVSKCGGTSWIVVASECRPGAALAPLREPQPCLQPAGRSLLRTVPTWMPL